MSAPIARSWRGSIDSYIGGSRPARERRSLHELLHAWPQETALRCVITERSPLSPLLNTRPSDRVTYRLLAACLVMAAIAIVIAISAGDYGRPSGASPAFMAVGAVCAALVAYLLAASSRAVADPKLCWMAAGSGIACAGLLLSLLASPAIFPTGGPVSQSADAGAARYLVWHAGLAAAALLAVTGVRPTRAQPRRADRALRPAAGVERGRRRPARRPRGARQRLHGAAQAARRGDRARPGRRRARVVARPRTAPRRGARCA